MCDEDPARVQAALAAFVERGSEQRCARPNRVGAVGDNHVKGLRGLVNKVNAVVNHQAKAGIVIAAGIVVGQVLAAERDDARIDFHHGDGFNGTMAGHFTQHCAVAAADNQNMLRVTVRQERDVGHHFMINKLVALGGLHNAVQRHHAAKGSILEDDQILVIGFLMVEHVINGKVLTKLVMQCFMPQRVVGHSELLLCKHPLRSQKMSET